ncbi:MAG: hypothetical protein HS100_06435 [Anaerolineales bacterium]|nr:hypothetical protein [Anaerolineales bacterium]
MENASVVVVAHFHIGIQQRGDLEFDNRAFKDDAETKRLQDEFFGRVG